jgi:hypothetical protein
VISIGESNRPDLHILVKLIANIFLAICLLATPKSVVSWGSAGHQVDCDQRFAMIYFSLTEKSVKQNVAAWFPVEQISTP